MNLVYIGNIALYQDTTSNIDAFLSIFIFSLEPQIQASIQEMGQLLFKVKGGGQVSLSQPSQRNSIQTESDTVIRPLMDLLEGR